MNYVCPSPKSCPSHEDTFVQEDNITTNVSNALSIEHKLDVERGGELALTI